uniref:RING-CH-type domain-containing protein n=1 Tax=Noctiluca scintillans TaxID=2966 RepID=A0A7S1F8L3_NOCSC|mmetsp:Transcript_43396/g.114328  ORF Transcript_43396/g.114328 Transcript_43396/m.114328 type:complete len:455 (+) Transcript_43396:73-1437(+)
MSGSRRSVIAARKVNTNEALSGTCMLESSGTHRVQRVYLPLNFLQERDRLEGDMQVFLSVLEKEGGETARSLGAALLLVQSLVNRFHAGEPCLRQLHDAVTRVNTTVSTRQVQLTVLDSAKEIFSLTSTMSARLETKPVRCLVSVLHDAGNHVLDIQPTLASELALPFPESSSMAALNQSEADDESFCRICFVTGSESTEPLVRPCACTGSMGHVHSRCLLSWIEQTSGVPRCEVCRSTIRTRTQWGRSRGVNHLCKPLTDPWLERSDLLATFLLSALQLVAAIGGLLCTRCISGFFHILGGGSCVPALAELAIIAIQLYGVALKGAILFQSDGLNLGRFGGTCVLNALATVRDCLVDLEIRLHHLVLFNMVVSSSVLLRHLFHHSLTCSEDHRRPHLSGALAVLPGVGGTLLQNLYRFAGLASALLNILACLKLLKQAFFDKHQVAVEVLGRD